MIELNSSEFTHCISLAYVGGRVQVEGVIFEQNIIYTIFVPITVTQKVSAIFKIPKSVNYELA